MTKKKKKQYIHDDEFKSISKNTCNLETDSDDDILGFVKEVGYKAKFLSYWMVAIPIISLLIGFLMYTCVVFYYSGVIRYQNYLYKAKKRWNGHKSYLNETICTDSSKEDFYGNAIDHSGCDEARTYIKFSPWVHACSLMAAETRIAMIYSNFMKAISGLVDTANNPIYFNIITLVVVWSIGSSLVPVIFKVISNK